MTDLIDSPSDIPGKCICMKLQTNTQQNNKYNPHDAKGLNNPTSQLSYSKQEKCNGKQGVKLLGLFVLSPLLHYGEANLLI